MPLSRCWISRKQQVRLLELFVAEVIARTAADLIGQHRNSAMLHYRKLRHLIAHKMAETEPEFYLFECDESYFDGVRKDKCGRGVAVKVCVFGIPKPGGKGHVLPVTDASSHTGFGGFPRLYRSPAWYPVMLYQALLLHKTNFETLE